MERFGVDENARQTLFSLAQLSEAGRQAANAVVSKLLKKEADHQDCDNPSAFVHCSCMRVRKDLHPWVGDRGKAGSWRHDDGRHGGYKRRRHYDR